MNGEKKCYSCVFGINRLGGEDISCNNGYVRKLRRKTSKPDPYDCEWYEDITEDYVSDVDRVARTW